MAQHPSNLALNTFFGQLFLTSQAAQYSNDGGLRRRK